MEKKDLTAQLAAENNMTAAEAADELDRIMHQIMRRLRRGQAASLPGLGKFSPGQTAPFSTKNPLSSKNDGPGRRGGGGKQ